MKINVVRILFSALFIGAGVTHFLHRELFAAIVPPHMGDPVLDVAISGIAEILGGIGLLIPATRFSASIGLFVLLVAVWPANWYMAIQAKRFAALAPAWALWARLPLQLVFMAIVLRIGKAHDFRQRREQA